MLHGLFCIYKTGLRKSSYSARFSATGLNASVSSIQIGKIDSMTFRGEMNVRFLHETRTLKECIMTMIPGMTTIYDVF